MRAKILTLLSLLLITTPLATPLLAQAPAASGSTGSTEPKPEKIHWQEGPFTAKLGNVAELKIPAGYLFADGAEARRLLELTGNPPSGEELGVVTPASKADADSWIVYFEFSENGYVKDAEGDKIDAPALLKSMQEGTEQSNEERKKRGWTPFHLLSWQTMPFYDKTTHNLTWSTLGVADDKDKSQTINYNVRILGRRGVMRTDMLLAPGQEAAIAPFNELMKGYSFTPGSRYADFVKGDKVAEYGLTALIAGGATAVAMKTGLFAKLLAMLAGLWKLIVVAFAGLAARFKKIWAAITGKKKQEEEPQAPTPAPSTEPLTPPTYLPPNNDPHEE